MTAKKKEELPKIQQQLFDFEIKGQISARSTEEAGDVLWVSIYEKARGLLVIQVVPNR